MKCAIYCRVSTEEQAIGGHSIEAQKQELIKYCSAFSYEIYDLYVDAGFTAATMERPELKRMLQDSMDYDIALVWRLDRISRDMADLMKILEIFQNNNVAFKSKTENFDTSTASGKLMLNMLGSFAEFERASISERIKLAHKKILNEGKWRGGDAPFGYQITSNKVLGVNEAEAEIVSLMFDWSANKNIGTRTISADLSKLGCRTRSGKPFTSDYVTKILKNPIYYGEMIYGRQGKVKKDGKKRNVYYKNYETYPGDFEPIINKDLFNKSKENMEIRKLNRGTSGSIPNLLGGLIYCGHCKEYMLRNISKDGEKFFVCRRYKQYGECTHHYVSEERVLKEIIKATGNLVINKSDIVKMNKKLTEREENQIKNIQKNINDLEKKIYNYTLIEDRLLGLIERGIITEEEFIRRKNKYLKEQDQLNQGLKELKSKYNIVQEQKGNRYFQDGIKLFNEEFNALPFEVRKKILKSIIERIEIMDNTRPYERKTIHIYFKI